jgi:hypothetical protein
MSSTVSIQYKGIATYGQIRVTKSKSHSSDVVCEKSEDKNTHVLNLKRGQVIEVLDDEQLHQSLTLKPEFEVCEILKNSDSNKAVIDALNEKVSKLESENQNLSKQVSDLENQNKDLVEKVSKFNRSKKTDENSQ